MTHNLTIKRSIFGLTEDIPLTFFRGKTLDGYAWVLAFEGGPTATNPDLRCRVKGYVGSRKIHTNITRGSELRKMLPYLNISEVREWL